MEVTFLGTAGPDGWTAPGCRCISCLTPPDSHRLPLSTIPAILPPEVVLLDPKPFPQHPPEPPPKTASPVDRTPSERAATPPPNVVLPRNTTPPERAADPPPNVASPDHETLPERPTKLLPKVVLIDYATLPERLAELRRTGQVGDGTHVVAVGLDHRAGPMAEMERRLGFWGARAVPDGFVLDTAQPYIRQPLPRRTLVLGGSRSGKSAEAELRLAAEPYVTYVATGPSGEDDPEWAARISAHRDRRPAHWETVESTDLAGVIAKAGAPLLIDGIGTWVSTVQWLDPEGYETRCDELVEAWRQTPQPIVAVSDEVGLSVVPATASGRRFRDALGRLNQRLAAESEEVCLVVAGRVTRL